MQFWINSGIGYLPSLLGLFFSLLIGITAIKMLMPKSSATLKSWYMISAPRFLKFAATLGFLGLSFFAGYGYRDHQLLSNTRTYFGVSILSQQSDRRYQVKIPGFPKSYDWEFCDPLKMPSPVIDIRYEQHYGCKLVNGVGFVSIHQENQNELQTRRNSSPSATAAYARLEK